MGSKIFDSHAETMAALKEDPIIQDMAASIAASGVPLEYFRSKIKGAGLCIYFQRTMRKHYTARGGEITASQAQLANAALELAFPPEPPKGIRGFLGRFRRHTK